MRRFYKILIIFSLVFNSSPFFSAPRLHINTGISYIEHYSLGLGLNTEKYTFTATFGSDFFVNLEQNKSWFLEANRILPNFQFGPLIPVIGLKSGYVIYSDTYYRWEFVTAIPYGGVRYALTNKCKIEFDLGLSYSRVLMVQRLSFGNFGWYKEYLPEVKLGIYYSLW